MRHPYRSASAFQWTLLFAAAFVLLSGCGKPTEPWGKVEGTVLQNGKPVEPAVVNFIHQTKGTEITAPTDAEGKFVIKTPKFPGLPVGDYKVVVTPAPQKIQPSADGMTYRERIPPAPPTKIPKIYQSAKTTPLKATVTETNEPYTFDLK